MEVLASFVGGWGHAEPLLGATRVARDRGHRVTFAGQAAVVPRLAALGFETVVVGPDTVSADRLPLQRPDREHERRVMADHFVRRFGKARATMLAVAIAETRPGLVICDEVDAGALVAAELAGIPAVTVQVIAAGRLTSPTVIGEAWTSLRRVHGLTDDSDGSRLGGSLAIAPFPASFRAPELPVTSRWHAVRPTSIATTNVERSLVYATLGTIFNVESGDLLARVVAGLDLAGLESLLTVGPNIATTEFTASARVRIEQFVPQAEVLGGCAAVVCHGGSGTLMAALSAGVPAVVLPMGADQMDNADRCEELGCGVVLDAVEASPTDIADAIQRVIGESRFAAAARQLADEAAHQPRLDDLKEFTALLGA